MNTNIERKKKYIKIAYEILENEGIEGIKIRKIAEAAGCTSAVLYKHFDNLEHLLILASVRFLEPYIRRFKEVESDRQLNPIEADLILWKAFIEEAFHNLPFYDAMFFGGYKDQLESTIYEYYQLFPEELQDFDGFSVSILFSNDLNEREYIRLRRAANEGLLTMGDARMLSRLSVAAFHGLLLEHRHDYKEKGVAEAASKECFFLIRELFQRFLKK